MDVKDGKNKDFYRERNSFLIDDEELINDENEIVEKFRDKKNSEE